MIPVGVIGQGRATVSGSPTSFNATGYSNYVVLGWAAPSFNGGLPVTSYTLKLFDSTILYTGLNTSFTHTGLPPYPELYSYTIVATNAAGDSATASASTSTTG
jgi:hypothetical protein